MKASRRAVSEGDRRGGVVEFILVLLMRFEGVADSMMALYGPNQGL